MRSARFFALSTLLATTLPPLSAWAQTQPSAPLRPDVEDVARFCELFVDDFALVSSGYRGTSSLELQASLRTRPGDDVAGVGLYARFHEDAYTKTFDASGNVVSETRTERDAAEALPARREPDGRWKATFLLEFDNYGQTGAQRALEAFAFFVDLREGALIKRLWVKAGTRDFDASDFAPSRWFYSQPVFLGGYSTARYLWRDGGSPVFATREACAR